MLSQRSSLLSLVILCALASSAVAQFEVARLVAHDGQPSDQFGASVGIDGDTAIVGAPFADGAAPDTGAAYVFRSVNGNWIEEAKLVPGDPYVSAHFGTSVAIDGNRVVISSTDVTVGGSAIGAAYVFRRTGTFPFTAWSQQAKLLASDGFIGQGFGSAVSMSSGSVAVCAQIPNSEGAVYIYVSAGAVWSEQAKLTCPSGGSTFGASVSLANDSVLVGSPRGGGPNGSVSGSAFVFVRSAGFWSLQKVFSVPYTLPEFGRTVSLEGDTALIGMPGAAAADVFVRVGSVWSGVAALYSTQPPSPGDLAASVVLAGQRGILGGPTYSTATSSNLGIALVFTDSNGTWSQQGSLRPKLPLQNGRFGTSLAASGELVVAGCPDGNGVTLASGSVVILSLSPPAPVTYCSAKVNSHGCLPAITVQGAASATDTQPFLVGAAAVLNNKFGLLFFGTSGPANFPFQGGALCVLPPIRRTDSTLSGGNAGVDDCSGTYSFNFNALIQSGLYPDLTAGVLVDCQYWSRDPASPSTTGLTNAVEFGIGF